MRRIILTYIFLMSIGSLAIQAQVPINSIDSNGTMRDQYGNQIDPSTQPDNLEDSTGIEIQSIPPKLYMWTLSETLGERTMVPADTLSLNFQNTNLVEGMTGHYNYLGNLGTPRLSRLFFERRYTDEPTTFLAPLSSFYVRPDELHFTNSNVPYTNLTYYKAGNKVNGEERFKSYFSVNANKRLAFGFNIDYLYGRGYYANQSTAFFNAGLFASYIGERYQMQAMYNNFSMKMNENGGITDDQYVTRPENMPDVGGTTYFPVNLEETSNRNHNFYVHMTQRYRLGFTRETTKIEETKDENARRKAQRDSTAIPMDTLLTEEFVPVTSFIHTFHVERSNHRFRSGAEPTGDENLYENTYLQEGMSNDSTLALSFKNVLGISLLEGFNKYAKAGLTAYASHQVSRYTLMNLGSDGTTTTEDGEETTRIPLPNQTYTEHELYVGGELSKREGRLMHYRANGEVGLAGKAAGHFPINVD